MSFGSDNWDGCCQLQKFIKSILDVADNLERAAASVPPGEAVGTSGYRVGGLRVDPNPMLPPQCQWVGLSVQGS
jgi:hypothetical protein